MGSLGSDHNQVGFRSIKTGIVNPSFVRIYVEYSCLL